MSNRFHLFEYTCDISQIEDVTASILHTVLFYRSLGKISYKNQGKSYSMGTVGYQDVDCATLDFTYVSCTSDDLNEALNREIGKFAEALRERGIGASGQMTLEFYQMKKCPCMFPMERVSWEVWTVRLNLVEAESDNGMEMLREKIEDRLMKNVLEITKTVNGNGYKPRMPSQMEVGLVFDTSFKDVQPYLFKMNFATST